MSDPALLVGFDTSDDACVYKISDELAMIQTVDFFPPIVDDPYLYGQIAAANSLSDVYAMGGEPRLALNLLCFPSSLPLSDVRGILEGGQSKVLEAGAVIAGGHSIEDAVPKYGLCVTGFVHPQRLWANNTAREGDALILTKPLGSGILATAHKAGLIDEAAFAEAVRVMSTLNRVSRDCIAVLGAHACTDVTGFGLLGHALEMAQGSGVSIELYCDSLPIMAGVIDLARDGIIPGGAHRNMDYIRCRANISTAAPRHLLDIMADPQTSGGLLAAVDEVHVDETLKRLESAGTAACVVGHIVKKQNSAIIVK